MKSKPKENFKNSVKGGSNTHHSDSGQFFPSENNRKDVFFSPSTFQPKPDLSDPNDKYEHEVDRLADQVVDNITNGIENNDSSPVRTHTTLQKNTIQLQRGQGSEHGVSARRRAQLREMARDPGNFIGVWNSSRTSADEHSVVIEAMDGYYGTAFTNEFVRLAEANQLVTGGFVTSHRSTATYGELTTERLHQSGYSLMRTTDRVLIQGSEVWIHPSGHTITIGRENQETSEEEQTAAPEPPQNVTIPRNPETVYGPRVVTLEEEAMRPLFPCQSASLFENGTIECYNNDGSIYTLIPQGTSRNPTIYAGYDDDGVQTITWIDENDMAETMRSARSQ